MQPDIHRSICTAGKLHYVLLNVTLCQLAACDIHFVAAGKLQADAAAAEGVKVFLFSILEDVTLRSKARTMP